MKQQNKTACLIAFSMIVTMGLCVCPNGCSGHGKCVSNNCVCYESVGVDGTSKSYTGSDCSLVKCMEGNPFASVSSKYPVSNSDYSPDYRELDESVSNNKRELSVSTMKLGELLDETDKTVWKVSGIDEFLKLLPKMGGIIQCTVGEVKESKVEVIGVYEDKTTAYVKFPADAAAVTKDTVVTCDEVLSIRKTMVYVNIDQTITTPPPAARMLNNNTRQLTGETLTWNYYGKIMKDLGLLEKPTEAPKQERRNLEETSYEKKDFRFACYKPPDASKIANAITVYDGVTAIYTEGAEPSTTALVFTFTSATPPTAASVCYCLMDGDVSPITIEQTELGNFVHKNENDNSYNFGKYTSSDSVDSNKYAVIQIAAKEITNNAIEISSSSDLLGNGRLVYVDVYNNGVLSEENGTITDTSGTKSLKLTDTKVAGIVLPYIKTHSSNPLINPPPAANLVSGSTVYEVYNLADKLIMSLDDKLGGILKCSYTKSDKTIVDVSADVKGYKKSGEIIALSYIEFSDKNIVISSMKCSGISSIRKDFTMYNPMKLDTTANTGNYDSDNKLSWKGYNTILKDVIVTSRLRQLSASEVNFACYTPTTSDKKITIYDTVTIDTTTVSSDIKFTIIKTTTPNYPSNGDICYLAAKIDTDGSTVSKITDLSTSDLGAYIREGEEEGSYYYGKYTIPSEGIITELDGKKDVPIFKLDNTNNKIEQSKIVLVEKDVQSDDLEYLSVGQTIFINIINTEGTNQYDHKATIIPSSNSRLLGDSTVEIPFTPSIPSGYTSTGTIRLASPAESIEIVGSALDDKKLLYKVSGFIGDVLSKLPQLGGKVQCKYMKTVVEDKTTSTTAEMGIVDVKAKEDASNSFIQFDHEIEKKPTDISTANPKTYYYIEDITCNEIQSTRNDMTLLNPTIITTTGGNYDSDNRVLTWKGYIPIFTTVGFDLTSPKTVRFACYNPKLEGNKEVVIHEEVTAEVLNDNDVGFTFAEGDNLPKENEICYLLTTSSGGEIDIERSDLSELIRKEADGKYYYGKYGNVDSKTQETIENDDGSITQILGSESFSDKKEDVANDNKIYIGKLANPESPSIAYPPSLITTGMKKLIVAGTILNIDGVTTQILKVKVNENNKFELSLSNTVVVRFPRLLSDSLPSLTITFSSEQSIHKSLECSGQGSCDRTSGVCNCFDGFSGSACQRLDCPNNCNGNGRCVPLNELLSNNELENGYEGFGNKHVVNDGSNTISFDNQVYGCLCDKRHRGYDCSLIECPSGVDPEGGTNDNSPGKDDEYRDCSGRGICNYSTGVCECFDGFSGEGCQNQVQMM